MASRDSEKVPADLQQETSEARFSDKETYELLTKPSITRSGKSYGLSKSNVETVEEKYDGSREDGERSSDGEISSNDYPYEYPLSDVKLGDVE